MRILMLIPEEGYELTFREPAAPEPKVLVDDEPAFDHIIFFAPETKSKHLQRLYLNIC